MLKKELEEIVLKEADIIPFLKKLTPQDKKTLVPFLKTFKVKIFEQKHVKKKSARGGVSYSFHNTYSERKRALVEKACFVCFNKTDINKVLFNASDLAVSDDYIENIIPWYKPKWYEALLNENIPWALSYDKSMSLSKAGLFEPSRAFILAKLSSAIIENKLEDKKYRRIYKPEVLLEHKETLDEHIWYLFEEETGINNYYDYLNLENYNKGNSVWIDTFVDLSNENRLDRKKLLIATLYTSTKGFNKSLSGWFFDLLIKLNPTKDEVITLQNEFFSALNSPHSKVVNTVLKNFKTVTDDKKFKYKIFIENASILLNSETKSVVNSTLMILDKLAKTHKLSSTSICIKAAEALLNNDEKIQLRAAKIIQKYGNPKKQELLDEVGVYADNLFHSAKETLSVYIVGGEETDDIFEVEEMDFLSEENRIPTYNSLDDLIFFVSQVIDNNEVYHIDLLLSYLPKLNLLITKENVAKLEPIFKRCLDLSLSYDWNSQIGILEREAAQYLNDYSEILMKKYPSELASFRKAKDKKIKKLKEEKQFGQHHIENLEQIENRSVQDYVYQNHRYLFVRSKQHIKKGLGLDLLSMPTHAPCWIDPKVFIERFESYRNNNQKIDLFDFQIAMGRLYSNKKIPNLQILLKKIKIKEFRKVLEYHFDLVGLKGNIQSPQIWVQSVLCKNIEEDLTYFQEFISNPLQKERGAYEWYCKKSDHFYMDYDYVKRKKVKKKIVRKELEFKDFNLKKTEPSSIASSLKSIFSKKNKQTKLRSIYDCMHFQKKQYYLTIHPHDDIKFLLLSPNNPSVFLSQVIHSNLTESTFSGETSKKNMVNLLKGLYEIWHRSDYKEPTYLFLATGLLCSDKVSRELASEIWIKANSSDKINNTLLGQILGKLEYGEYAPMKRFTDLLSERLFNVSKKHNESLYILLDHMIGSMDDLPIRGIKKLLEVFLELKYIFPEIKISELSKSKLAKWKESKSLIPNINKLT